MAGPRLKRARGNARASQWPPPAVSPLVAAHLFGSPGDIFIPFPDAMDIASRMLGTREAAVIAITRGIAAFAIKCRLERGGAFHHVRQDEAERLEIDAAAGFARCEGVQIGPLSPIHLEDAGGLLSIRMEANDPAHRLSVHGADLRHHCAQLRDLAAPARRGASGRPHKPEWLDFACEASEWIFHHGPPDASDSLVEHMLDWAIGQELQFDRRSAEEALDRIIAFHRRERSGK